VATADLVPDSYWTPSAASQGQQQQTIDAQLARTQQQQQQLQPQQQPQSQQQQAPIFGNPLELYLPTAAASATVGAAASAAAHASAATLGGDVASDMASDMASAASFLVGFALVILLLRALYCASHAAAQKWSRYRSASAVTGEPLQASRYRRVSAAVATRPSADDEAGVGGEGGGDSCHAQSSSPPEPQRGVQGYRVSTQQHKRPMPTHGRAQAQADARQARSAQVASKSRRANAPPKHYHQVGASHEMVAHADVREV